MVKLPSLEEMLKAGMHFGHKTSKWHPKMAPYIFGARGGVYIIDLSKTQKKMEESLEFMKKITAEGKTILFVGTKNQVKKPMMAMAKDLGMPYITEKWIGGCLTNFAVVKKTIRKYMSLVEQKMTGKLEKYTKKERSIFDKEIEKLEAKVGGLTTLNKLPDAVFIYDIKKEKTAIVEARKKNIPVIAVCDTNVNPDNANYIIPANDDATKTVKIILSAIAEAVKEGLAEQKRTAVK